jgi:hypothetical protein
LKDEQENHAADELTCHGDGKGSEVQALGYLHRSLKTSGTER